MTFRAIVPQHRTNFVLVMDSKRGLWRAMYALRNKRGRYYLVRFDDKKGVI